MALLDKGDVVNVSAPQAQENNQYMGFSVPFFVSLSGYSLEREDKMYDIIRTGEILKELRKRRDKTQERVAEEIGINIKTYRAIESGVRGGSVDTLYLIAEYFGCTLDYLVSGNHVESEISDILNRMDEKKKKKVLLIIKDIVDVVTC